MKKYRLKRWYPSLQRKTIKGNIANWCSDEMAYEVRQNGDRIEILDKTEVENNPDFWEEVKQPLFVTDDGVGLFDEEDKLFIVNKEFYKKESKISNLYDKANRKYFKYFFHESNADEYIWRNKPVFSYEDIIEHAYNNPKYRIFIEKLAIERAKE